MTNRDGHGLGSRREQTLRQGEFDQAAPSSLVTFLDSNNFARGHTQKLAANGARPRLSSIVWPRALIAVGAGAVYGLLALEAVSPVGILLVGWVVAILLLAWRIPLKARAVAACAGGLIVGFGLLWAIVLEAQRAGCKPSTCVIADPSTDVLYAFAFLAPVIAVASAEIGVRAWLLRQRPSSQPN
jgi:hypothetical protein